MGFAEQLISWYEGHKRDLPWRQTADPYVVWLSEIILQQTRVDQGLPYFQRFIEKYPNVKMMAQAPLEEVMRLWQGLGYYSRARHLHASAKLVANEYDGEFPGNYQALLTLPGVGPYTAAAIASFSFGLPHAVVDGNVIRVLSRLHGITDPIDQPKTRKQLDALAQDLLSKTNPATFNQAIMEFGALQCKPTNPDCELCPFNEKCVAFRTNMVDRLPMKSSKVKVRERYFNYLVLNHKDTTLLQKRTASGIWQELHEPPLLEATRLLPEKTMRTSLLWKQLIGDATPIDVRIIAPKPHKLTHQTIHSRFFIVTVKIQKPPTKSDWLIVKVKDLHHYAVPRMIELVFQELFDEYAQ